MPPTINRPTSTTSLSILAVESNSQKQASQSKTGSGSGSFWVKTCNSPNHPCLNGCENQRLWRKMLKPNLKFHKNEALSPFVILKGAFLAPEEPALRFSEGTYVFDWAAQSLRAAITSSSNCFLTSALSFTFQKGVSREGMSSLVPKAHYPGSRDLLNDGHLLLERAEFGGPPLAAQRVVPQSIFRMATNRI